MTIPTRRRWRRALPLLLAALPCLVPVLADDPEKPPELPQVDNDLFDALKEGDLAAASAALAAGANIDSKSPRGQQTPLMQNVLHGRIDSVKWCLENGANASIGERDGYTPMHGAAFQGRREIAELLFKHGVGLRDVHKDGHEPAVRSCWGPDARHLETVSFFLDNGVPIDDIYDKCMEMAKNPDTIRMLEQRRGAQEL